MPVLTLYPQVTADNAIWQSNSSGFTTAAPGYLGGTGAAGVFYNAALRFPGINIPQGSVINSAILTLYAHDDLSGVTANVLISGNDEDNAAAPASYGAGDTKTLTTASVPWSPAAWTTNTGYPSPDLATIIQEIVSRSTWTSNNALMLIIRDNGTNDLNANRSYYNFVHGDAGYYPKLVVNYTPAVVGTATFTSVVGTDDGAVDNGTFDVAGSYAALGGGRNSFFRFQSFGIPKGSVILSASITFYSNANSAQITCNVRITANDVDYSEAPTSTAELNALVKTTAYVDWSSMAGWTTGAAYTTPDFKAVIQEVIDRASWGVGNPVTILLFDNGSTSYALRYPRTVEDAVVAYRPKLTITYVPGIALLQATGAITLPALTFDGSISATNLNQCVLPMFVVSGHAEVAPVITGSITLPMFTVSGGTGLHLSADITLPFFTVNSKTGESASITLPRLSVTGSILSGFTAAGAVTLPVFTVAGTVITGRSADGVVELPSFTVAGTASFVPVITGALTLPALTVRGTMSQSDRFASYVLRYAR
jgi:hypothetical protein